MMRRIVLPRSDEKLIEECDVSAFRSGGKGGQHVNKVSTGVRIRHRPSGIVVTCRQERSQYRNRQICIERLREKVERLNYRPPKRIKTKISVRKMRQRREERKRLSEKKQMRRKPVREE